MSSSSKDERRADLLMSVIATVSRALEGNGIAKDRAMKIAIEASDQLRKDFGGEQFYMPKGCSFDSLLVHHKIFSEFNGKNMDELCRKYNFSIPYLYRVLNKLQSERQPSLF